MIGHALTLIAIAAMAVIAFAIALSIVGLILATAAHVIRSKWKS